MAATNRASLAAMTDGYGAAGFCPTHGDLWVELQVMPGRVCVYLNGYGTYRGRRATWEGAEAVAIAGAVCDGLCPAGVLADWLEEHTPATCDAKFDPAAELRRCVL